MRERARVGTVGGAGATLIACLTALVALAIPAVASAAVRHTAPNGTGPPGSCPAANPCEIEDAIEHPSVADGDHIVLADGDYNISDTLTVQGEITVRGANPGHTGARIISSAINGIFMITPAAVVRDLTLIKNGNAGRGVWIINGTLDRAQVIAPAATACELGSVDSGNARIRNSVCSGGGDAAVRIEVDGGSPEFGILENVTAYSSQNQTAIRARGVNNGQVQLIGRNVIADGDGATGKDIVAEDDNAGASSADVAMSSSSYSGVSFGAQSTVTPIGAGTNVGPASLVDAAGGDFRQLPGSQTVDAGILPPNGPGPVDWAGDARVQGPAIDIGADEAVDPERILKLLGKKVKAKRTLKLKARCQDAPCEITGKAIIKPKGSKKKTRTIRKASAAAGSKTKIKVKLPKGLAKKLKRRGGKVKVRATGTDPVGFTDKEKRTYKVKKKNRKRK